MPAKSQHSAQLGLHLSSLLPEDTAATVGFCSLPSQKPQGSASTSPTWGLSTRVSGSQCALPGPDRFTSLCKREGRVGTIAPNGERPHCRAGTPLPCRESVALLLQGHTHRQACTRTLLPSFPQQHVQDAQGDKTWPVLRKTAWTSSHISSFSS